MLHAQLHDALFQPVLRGVEELLRGLVSTSDDAVAGALSSASAASDTFMADFVAFQAQDANRRFVEGGADEIVGALHRSRLELSRPGDARRNALLTTLILEIATRTLLGTDPWAEQEALSGPAPRAKGSRLSQPPRGRLLLSITERGLSQLADAIGTYVHTTHLSGVPASVRALEERAAITLFAIVSFHEGTSSMRSPFSMVCVNGLEHVLQDSVASDTASRWARLLGAVNLHSRNAADVCGMVTRTADLSKGKTHTRIALAHMIAAAFLPKSANGFGGTPDEVVRCCSALMNGSVHRWITKRKFHYHTFAAPMATTLVTVGGRSTFRDGFFVVIGYLAKLLNDERRHRSRFLACLNHMFGFYLTILPRRVRAPALGVAPPTPVEVDQDTEASPAAAHSTADAFRALEELLPLCRKVTHTGTNSASGYVADLLLTAVRGWPREGIRLLLSHIPQEPSGFMTEAAVGALQALCCLSLLVDPSISLESCSSLPLRTWFLGSPPGSGPIGFDAESGPLLRTPFSCLHHAKAIDALADSADGQVVFDVLRFCRGDPNVLEAVRSELRLEADSIRIRLWVYLNAFVSQCCGAQFQRSARQPSTLMPSEGKEKQLQLVMAVAVDLAGTWMQSGPIVQQLLELNAVAKGMLHANPVVAAATSTLWLPQLLRHGEALQVVASITTYAMGVDTFDDHVTVAIALEALGRVLGAIPTEESDDAPVPAAERDVSLWELTEICAFLALGHANRTVRERAVRLLFVVHDVARPKEGTRRTFVADSIDASGALVVEEAHSISEELRSVGVLWADDRFKSVGSVFASIGVCTPPTFTEIPATADTVIWAAPVLGRPTRACSEHLREIMQRGAATRAFIEALQTAAIPQWALLGCLARRHVPHSQRFTSFLVEASEAGAWRIFAVSRIDQDQDRVSWEHWKALFTVWFVSMSTPSKRHTSARNGDAAQKLLELSHREGRWLIVQDCFDTLAFNFQLLERIAAGASAPFAPQLIEAGLAVASAWTNAAGKMIKKDRRRWLHHTLCFHLVAGVGAATHRNRKSASSEGDNVAATQLVSLISNGLRLSAGSAPVAPTLPAPVDGQWPGTPNFELSFAIRWCWALARASEVVASAAPVRFAEELSGVQDYVLRTATSLASSLMSRKRVESPLMAASQLAQRLLSSVSRLRVALRQSALPPEVFPQLTGTLIDGLAPEGPWPVSVFPSSMLLSNVAAITLSDESALARTVELLSHPAPSSVFGTPTCRFHFELLMAAALQQMSARPSAAASKSSFGDAARLQGGRRRPPALENFRAPSMAPVVWPAWTPLLVLLGVAHISRRSATSNAIRDVFGTLLGKPASGAIRRVEASVGEARSWASAFVPSSLATKDTPCLDATGVSSAVRVGLAHIAATERSDIRASLFETLGPLASCAVLDAAEWRDLVSRCHALGRSHPSTADRFWSCLSDAMQMTVDSFYAGVLSMPDAMRQFVAQQLGRQSALSTVRGLFCQCYDDLRDPRHMSVTTVVKVCTTLVLLLRFTTPDRLFDGWGPTCRHDGLTSDSGKLSPQNVPTASPNPSSSTLFPRTPSARPVTPKTPIADRIALSASPSQREVKRAEEYRSESARRVSIVALALLSSTALRNSDHDWCLVASATASGVFRWAGGSAGDAECLTDFLVHCHAQGTFGAGIELLAQQLLSAPMIRWCLNLLVLADTIEGLADGCYFAVRHFMVALQQQLFQRGSVDGVQLIGLDSAPPTLLRAIVHAVGSKDLATVVNIAGAFAELAAVDAVIGVADAHSERQSVFPVYGTLQATVWAAWLLCLSTDPALVRAGSVLLEGLYRGGSVQLLCAEGLRCFPSKLPLASDEWSIVDSAGIETAAVFGLCSCVEAHVDDAITTLLSTMGCARPGFAEYASVLRAVLANDVAAAVELSGALVDAPDRAMPTAVATCGSGTACVALVVAERITQAPEHADAALAVAVMLLASELLSPSEIQVCCRLRDAVAVMIPKVPRIANSLPAGSMRKALERIDAVAPSTAAESEVATGHHTLVDAVRRCNLEGILESLLSEDNGMSVRGPNEPSARSPRRSGRRTRSARRSAASELGCDDIVRPGMPHALFDYVYVSLSDGTRLVAAPEALRLDSESEDHTESLLIDRQGIRGILSSSDSDHSGAESDTDTINVHE